MPGNGLLTTNKSQNPAAEHAAAAAARRLQGDQPDAQDFSDDEAPVVVEKPGDEIEFKEELQTRAPEANDEAAAPSLTAAPVQEEKKSLMARLREFAKRKELPVVLESPFDDRAVKLNKNQANAKAADTISELQSVKTLHELSAKLASLIKNPNKIANISEQKEVIKLLEANRHLFEEKTWVKKNEKHVRPHLFAALLANRNLETANLIAFREFVINNLNQFMKHAPQLMNGALASQHAKISSIVDIINERNSSETPLMFLSRMSRGQQVAMIRFMTQTGNERDRLFVLDMLSKHSKYLHEVKGFVLPTEEIKKLLKENKGALAKMVRDLATDLTGDDQEASQRSLEILQDIRKSTFSEDVQFSLLPPNVLAAWLEKSEDQSLLLDTAILKKVIAHYQKEKQAILKAKKQVEKDNKADREPSKEVVDMAGKKITEVSDLVNRFGKSFKNKGSEIDKFRTKILNAFEVFANALINENITEKDFLSSDDGVRNNATENANMLFSVLSSLSEHGRDAFVKKILSINTRAPFATSVFKRIHLAEKGSDLFESGLKSGLVQLMGIGLKGAKAVNAEEIKAEEIKAEESQAENLEQTSVVRSIKKVTKTEALQSLIKSLGDEAQKLMDNPAYRAEIAKLESTPQGFDNAVAFQKAIDNSHATIFGFRIPFTKDSDAGLVQKLLNGRVEGETQQLWSYIDSNKSLKKFATQQIVEGKFNAEALPAALKALAEIKGTVDGLVDTRLSMLVEEKKVRFFKGRFRRNHEAEVRKNVLVELVNELKTNPTDENLKLVEFAMDRKNAEFLTKHLRVDAPSADELQTAKEACSPQIRERVRVSELESAAQAVNDTIAKVSKDVKSREAAFGKEVKARREAVNASIETLKDLNDEELELLESERHTAFNFDGAKPVLDTQKHTAALNSLLEKADDKNHSGILDQLNHLCIVVNIEYYENHSARLNDFESDVKQNIAKLENMLDQRIACVREQKRRALRENAGTHARVESQFLGMHQRDLEKAANRVQEAAGLEADERRADVLAAQAAELKKSVIARRAASQRINPADISAGGSPLAAPVAADSFAVKPVVPAQERAADRPSAGGSVGDTDLSRLSTGSGNTADDERPRSPLANNNMHVKSVVPAAGAQNLEGGAPSVQV